MNQPQATTELPALSVEPVDDSLWRVYDEGGWQQLRDGNYLKARRYFRKAWRHIEGLSEDDFRRGRTLAGLAWAIYRTAATQWDEERSLSDTGQKETVDPDQLFRQANTNAEQAVRLLSDGDLPNSERKYLARAHYILGLTRVELCRGDLAEASLQSASNLFFQLNETKQYFEVLHYLGKLRQCRRNYLGAAQIYQQVFNEAPDTDGPECRAHALVDLANVWTWNGFVREAKQLDPLWQRIDKQLEPRAEKDATTELLFRGRVVFARVSALYGDYERARELLQSAHHILCGCQEISPICRAVLWIVSAELALERGDHERVRKCLEEFHLILHDMKLPADGFSCLEIVAIDAAVRQCVIECCTCCVVIRRTCCRRRVCRIYFTQQKTDLQDVDYVKVLALIVDGMRSRMHIQNGEFRCDPELANTIAGLKAHLNPHSLVIVPLLIARAEAKQFRRQSPVEVRALLQEVVDIVDRTKAPHHGVDAERHRLLGYWRSQLSEEELAAAMYTTSLRHGRNARAATHPMHSHVYIAYALAHASSEWPPAERLDKVRQSQEIVTEALRTLQQTVHCHDYRIASGLTTWAWLCLLAGCASSAERQSGQAIIHWAERGGVRRADALLGLLCTFVELDYAADVISKQYNEFLRLASGQIDVPMIALELNRVGVVLWRAGLFKSAEYAFRKACELYPWQDYGNYKPTARDNLKRLRQEMDTAVRKYVVLLRSRI